MQAAAALQNSLQAGKVDFGEDSFGRAELLELVEVVMLRSRTRQDAQEDVTENNIDENLDQPDIY